jgi:uncharacterized protein with beta-barrel porin domain
MGGAAFNNGLGNQAVGGTGGGGGGGGAGGFGAIVTGSGASSNTSSIAGGNGGAGGDGGGVFGIPQDVNGGNGGNGGAGGGGVVFVSSGAALTNGATILAGSGGNGGNGAAGIDFSGLGGQGAVGGAGVAFQASGGMLTNTSTIRGGNGGNGGNGALSQLGVTSAGGQGATGGEGVAFLGSGGTLMNLGTIQGGNGGAAGTGNPAGQNGAGGVGVSGSGLTVTNSGAIAGGLAGDGITLANAINFTGGVNTLTLLPGSSITGNVTAFSSADTLTLGGSGNGGALNAAQYQGFGVFNKTGSSTWTLLSAAGSPTSPWVISGGKLAAGNTNVFGVTSLITVSAPGTLDLSGFSQTIGSLAGSGTVNNSAVGFPTTLTTGGDNTSTTFAGTIQNGNSALGLTKQGTGVFTLSGTNSYTGATTIDAGTLLVNGSIAASATTVNSGGTLAGTGTVGNVTVNGGAVFAPGAIGAPGTMAVAGNLAFAPGATYLVNVTPANASAANVSGTATLTGAHVQTVFAPGSYLVHSYAILTSGGLIGSFSGVTGNVPAGFTESLVTVGNAVNLNLVTQLQLGGNGLTPNGQTIVNGLNNAFNGGSPLPPAFVNIFGLTGSNLSTTLTQISGETATGSQQTTFDAMGLFMGLLTDPFTNRTGSVGSPLATGYADEALGYGVGKTTDPFAMFTKAPPTFEQRWSVWAAGFGGSQSTSGNTLAGSNNTTSNIAGTAVGADYLISPNTIAGFALAGGGTNFSVANGGTGRSDLFQMGAYVRHNQGPAYLSAALAYGWQDITTNRTVTVAGLDQLRAEFNANAFSGRLEGGYRFVSPATFGIGITPYAAAQFVTFDLPAYTEQAISGTNNFALGYNAKNVTDARSELGVRTDRSWLVTDGVLTLRGRLAWAHDYDPDRSIAATFQSLPGASFVVNGAAQAPDSALATASIEMRWKSGWSAAATFEGEFSNVTQSYAGKGVVRYQW